MRIILRFIYKMILIKIIIVIHHATNMTNYIVRNNNILSSTYVVNFIQTLHTATTVVEGY